MSPPAFRGHLVSFSEISLTLGIMLGYVADAAFLGLPPGANWRFMLGLGIAMPSLLIALCLTGTFPTAAASSTVVRALPPRRWRLRRAHAASTG